MSKTFCVMPFFGAEYTHAGFTTNCCLMSEHNIQDVRDQMLQGIRPTSCKTCWELEDRDIKSDRLSKNESYDFYANRDLNYVIADCKNNLYSEQIVKLYTSNLCNGACVTCGPELSTHWASIKSIPIKLKSMSANVLGNVDFANLKMLSLMGGEPLHDKNIYSILQKLIDHNNTQCHISFVTNGSVKLTETQLEFFSKFNNLSICVSIDGVGKVFEYMRYPLKWDQLLENLSQYKSLAKHLTISYTLSNVNILYYKETVDWFNDNGLQHNHNIVTSPAYYNINSLPAKVKEMPDISHLFREHRALDDLLFNAAKKDILQQDKLKNINSKDFIPRFTDLF